MDLETHQPLDRIRRRKGPAHLRTKITLAPPVKLLRTVWVISAAAAWGLVLLSAADQLGTLAAAAQVTLVTRPIAWLIARIAAQIGASLVSLVMAGILYFRRPNEGLVLLTSFFLLVNGIVIAPLRFLEPYWAGAERWSYAVIQPLVFAPLLVAFLALFPNGRFTPAWTRRLVAAAVLYAPVGVFQMTARAMSRPTPVFVLAVSTWFALILSGMYAQFQRYRRFSNTIERQQTKWFLFGFSAALALVLVLTVLTIWLNVLPTTPTLPWWTPLINLGWAFAYSVLPVTLTMAVLRHRLFEIDLIINRTLMYGALTAGVIVLYALIVSTAGVLSLTGGNLLLALVATGLAAILFQPLRERLQRAVNRLTYGERDDPFEVLTRLGKRLETALPPDMVLPTLVETIAQTLKLPFVGIRVDGETVAAIGNPEPEPVRFPLAYQGERTGELLAAPRGPEERFTKNEMRLLRGLARQAGAAVRNAQLTADLQRSRQSLVTAREEERRRLRRDLHDGLGASLAALHLRTGSLGRLIHEDPQAAGGIVAEFRDELGASIEDIRRLVYALRPPALDELGLAHAVRALARRCAAPSHAGETPAGAGMRSGLSVQVDAPEALPPLPAAVEVAAYRIVQEALANVVHHAGAGACRVRIGLAEDLCIEVKDDGIGIADGHRAGVGLASMRERAAELGGSLVVERLPGGGTRVAAVLPLGGD